MTGLRKLILTGIGILLSLVFWDLNFMQVFILALELFFFFYLIDCIGNKFIFLELLALLAVTQWLFAPMIAQVIGVDMNVSFDQYFAYAVPGTCFYLLGLTLPLWHQQNLDSQIRQVFDRLSVLYSGKQNWGIVLMAVGFPFWIFQNSVSSGLNFIFYLLAYLLFIGICILLFTNYLFKWLYIGIGIFLLVVTTLLNGMIGTVLFWLFIIAVIYSCKRNLRWPYWGKLIFIFLGLWLVAVLQMAKTEYRVKTWDITQSEVSSKTNRKITQDPALMYELIRKQLFDFTNFGSHKVEIALIGRLNQGALVSLAMDYIPRRRPYGGGEVTLTNTFTAFIPRILWPEKPVVGQSEYFRKYTGIRLGKFHSATLGPLGDAYADFGRGGILFLGFFGLMIGQIFMFFVKKSQTVPALMLWFMGIYFTTITVTEVSVAIYINGVFKFLLFVYAIRLLLVHLIKLRV